MPFLRDNVPQSNNVTVLRAYLDRTLSSLDGWAANIDDAVNQLFRLQATSGTEIRYLWDDTIVIATPVGAGEIKADDADLTMATQFALSRFDDFGRLIFPASARLTFEGFFEINDLTRDRVFEYSFQSFVFRDTDLVVDVTFVSDTAGAPPQAGDLTQAQIWPAALPVPVTRA